MTRFARAEGSKASNKKVPEEATPWKLLKGKRKHSNCSEAQSSDSAPQERSGNRVQIVHSDRSNSWSVVDEQPSNSSKPPNKRSFGKSFQKMVHLETPQLVNAEMRSELKSGAQLKNNARLTGKWTGSSLGDKLKLEQIDEDVDIPNIIDRLEAKSNKLVKEGVKKCFKCRKDGHTYKDCPEKEESEICFTCGSTEHSFKQCKKRKRNGSNFAFATCFICKEQGHLSSACPDNPTGLYPYGGACHECGEVTHFSKDCPQKQKKIVKKQITVDTLLYDDIEGLPEDKPIPKPQRPPKKAKIVYF